MCGIIGVINQKDAESFVKNSLQKIAYRGIDGQDFYAEEGLCFGHALHSVVSNMPQPFIKGDFIFGANCEIYNWKELRKKYGLRSENDAKTLMDILIRTIDGKEVTGELINGVLKELDGVFAFFIYNKKEGYTIIARDVLGEKPLWFHYADSFMFASEKKAIESDDIIPEELNPRKIIFYDHESNKLKMFDQEFFKITAEGEIDIKKKKIDIKDLIDAALSKRIAHRKLGILFSGGIDSTIIAFLLKKKGAEFIAYMTVDEKKEHAIDEAKHIAQVLDFPLKVIKVNKNIVEDNLKEVINLIESANPVKVEVGMTMYLAMKEAKKDGIKVIFSGVGADDIFAGYSRMRMHTGINEDIISSLRRIYERDLYRDDVLSMSNSIEIRLPFLDHSLIRKMLSIPDIYKHSDIPKVLLREIAVELGLPEEFAGLKRIAAQYSSGISKLLGKITKEKGEQFKGKFFYDLYGRKNIKLGVLFSSGKDSTYAMHIQDRMNYEITCLIAIESENKDSFMFHTPAINIAKYQAESLRIPLILHKTKGEKESELEDMKAAIVMAKDKYKIQGIITGAIYSNYQRSRIEKICDELNLKVFSPLWHMDQKVEMQNLIREGYEIIMTKVAAEGLDKTWLGKPVTTEMIDDLVKLNEKIGINIAGEGGEFESLVLDAPMFTKRLKIIDSEIVEESANCAEFLVKNINLIKKS